MMDGRVGHQGVASKLPGNRYTPHSWQDSINGRKIPRQRPPLCFEASEKPIHGHRFACVSGSMDVEATSAALSSIVSLERE